MIVNASTHPKLAARKTARGMRVRRTPSASSSSGTGYGVYASGRAKPTARSAPAAARASSGEANSKSVPSRMGPLDARDAHVLALRALLFLELAPRLLHLADRDE